MRKSSEELQKHTLNLREGDYAKIQSYYPTVGAGPVIRKVISKFVDEIEGAAGNNRPKMEIEL